MQNLKNAVFERINDATTEVVSAAENTKGVMIHFITISARSGDNTFVRVGADGFLYYGNPSANADILHITDKLIPAGTAITISAQGGNSFICIGFEVLS